MSEALRRRYLVAYRWFRIQAIWLSKLPQAPDDVHERAETITSNVVFTTRTTLSLANLPLHLASDPPAYESFSRFIVEPRMSFPWQKYSRA